MPERGLKVFALRPVYKMESVSRVAFGLIRVVPRYRCRVNDQPASQRNDGILQVLTITHTHTCANDWLITECDGWLWLGGTFLPRQFGGSFDVSVCVFKISHQLFNEYISFPVSPGMPNGRPSKSSGSILSTCEREVELGSQNLPGVKDLLH